MARQETLGQILSGVNNDPARHLGQQHEVQLPQTRVPCKRRRLLTVILELIAVTVSNLVPGVVRYLFTSSYKFAI
eukprot:5790310-Amphidinium_carterae.1